MIIAIISIWCVVAGLAAVGYLALRSMGPDDDKGSELDELDEYYEIKARTEAMMAEVKARQ